MTYLIIGSTTCQACGHCALSAWPVDCEVFELECVGCGAMRATFNVAHRLTDFPTIETLGDFATRVQPRLGRWKS